ncbi:uncharacterized protein CC84DRAFT_1206930 [Paraphaeosphaeria sporulosa]|uniref:F-box domain-containing protein n=1 Tax=Paraphaeosphaeria sporulosa TaxID=1460663 RepID=A0A177C9S8_9PLEO|nr:uncharacterized protein CC84DRAFT_1206930 [Paraphaeosphaeria sporulosa]OAG03589.1 hypothetical protein CC84DRAFT_1206930 [Paraphaeosphaeria sporulosa]
MARSSALEQHQLSNTTTHSGLLVESTIVEMYDKYSCSMAKSITPPRLPTELWLQIFEQVDDVEFLWCTLRFVSRDYKAFVDRVFVTNYLPTISFSLSLPRLDPNSGRARYMRPVPGAEVTLHCENPDAESRRVVLSTPKALPSGDTIEQLTASGALTKERLDEAAAWMWFGKQRTRGVNVVTINKDIRWNEEEKVWVWSVEWKAFVNKYFGAKRASRRTLPATGWRIRQGPRT